MHIFLVRHGETALRTDADYVKTILGSTDEAPLVDKGRAQIDVAAHHLDMIVRDIFGLGTKLETVLPTDKIEIISGEAIRQIQTADIITDEFGFDHSKVRKVGFLAELGQGPVGELPTAEIDGKLAAEAKAVRESLKGPGDHYRNLRFPLHSTPQEFAETIVEDLFDFLNHARDGGIEVLVMSGSALNQLLLTTIMCGHSVDWFNHNVIDSNKPERGSIRHIEWPEGKAIGEMKDHGIIHTPEKSSWIERTDGESRSAIEK